MYMTDKQTDRLGGPKQSGKIENSSQVFYRHSKTQAFPETYTYCWKTQPMIYKDMSLELRIFVYVDYGFLFPYYCNHRYAYVFCFSHSNQNLLI